MSIRRKILIAVICGVLVLFAAFWKYWSPRAEVSSSLSFRDAFSIRLLVRTQTWQPILQILQQADGSVTVYTGKQTAPLAGGGYFFRLERKGGWKIVSDGGWQS